MTSTLTSLLPKVDLHFSKTYARSLAQSNILLKTCESLVVDVTSPLHSNDRRSKPVRLLAVGDANVRHPKVGRSDVTRSARLLGTFWFSYPVAETRKLEANHKRFCVRLAPASPCSHRAPTAR